MSVPIIFYVDELATLPDILFRRYARRLARRPDWPRVREDVRTAAQEILAEIQSARRTGVVRLIVQRPGWSVIITRCDWSLAGLFPHENGWHGQIDVAIYGSPVRVLVPWLYLIKGDNDGQADGAR